MNWVSAETGVSKLSFADRKKLYGQSTFPPGFEYYTGGVIQVGPQLKAATASAYVSKWDWRNRHGKDWVTKVTDQGDCGSCWAFAATGATEAAVNLYFNKDTIDLDLSEQDVVSCSGGGSCSGGYPSVALDYIKNTGIVDEAAFPYTATNNSCSNKSSNPREKIKIAGKIAFGGTTYPRTEDNLKAMIIKYGPLSGGVTNWSHALTVVGWKVVAAGDYFYYRNSSGGVGWITVSPTSSLIGTTVWLLKNSWADDWGDHGYLYLQSSISNISNTYGLLTPVTSVKVTRTVACVDNDGDGYYWWGTGSKPSTCPTCPNTPDGDDSNNTLGPLDAYGNCTPIAVVTVPVAEFTATSTTVTAGGSVSFTDQSTNSPTSWAWTFAGGTPATSTAQNPTVTYATEGTYNVTLVAENSGGSNTLTKAGYITVNPVPAPVVAFTASSTSIAAGGSVTFTDQSTNSPTSWAWTFTGGTPSASTSQNPVVTYSSAGTYSVALTAANSGGSGTHTKTNYITVSSVSYCASHGNATSEWISSVKLGTTTYSSSSSGTTGYQDLTANTFLVTPGSSVSITLTPKFSSFSKLEYWGVWIDYNGDGDFADSNEKVFTSSFRTSKVTGTIRIPSGLNLTTRMRVSMKRNSAPSYCGTFTYGEVEDYSINISSSPGSLKNATVSIDGSEGLGLMRIFPNPAGQELSIQVDEVMDGADFIIYNSLGMRMISGPIVKNITTLDISGFATGIYLISVRNNDTILQEKFIKR